MVDFETVYQYILTDDPEEEENLLQTIIFWFLEDFLAEFQRFSKSNGIDVSELDIEAAMNDYGDYLREIFVGLRERAREKRRELIENDYDSAILLLQFYIGEQFETIERSEQSNLIQMAQMLVAMEAERTIPGTYILKRWVPFPGCCPICLELSKRPPIPVDEPFLVPGEKIDLADGKQFIYKYVTRYVAVAHPNDRCHVEFEIHYN